MAKVIEFYVPDLFPKKVKSVPRNQRCEVIEFPKDNAALVSQQLGLVKTTALQESFRPRLMPEKELGPFPARRF